MRSLKLILSIAGLLCASTAYAGVPAWTVSESSGQVSIIAPGISKVAQRGGAVAVGEVVATGTNGRAVLVRGEEYLIVSPNSRIRVADPARSGGITQIMGIFGTTLFKIKKMASPHFGVQTPYLAAVVKGTTFSVTVTEQGASVQVVEGRVEVSTRDGGASYMVLPGDIASVNAGTLAQLNVAGHENKAIISEGPKADAPAAMPELEEPVMTETAASAAAETPMMTVIGAAVSEGPVSLESMTGGMVKGDTAMAAMTATMVSEPGAAPKPSELGAGTAETAVEALPPTPVQVAIAEGKIDPDPPETVALPPVPADTVQPPEVIASAGSSTKPTNVVPVMPALTPPKTVVVVTNTPPPAPTVSPNLLTAPPTPPESLAVVIDGMSSGIGINAD
jgi:FecR protein